MNLAMFAPDGQHIFTYPHFDKARAGFLLQEGGSVRLCFHDRDRNEDFAMFFRLTEAEDGLVVARMDAGDKPEFDKLQAVWSIDKIQNALLQLAQSGNLFGSSKCFAAPEVRP